MTRRLGFQRVLVTPTGDGASRVVLACSCCRVGRLVTSWEPLSEALAELRLEHQRQAPACPHAYIAPLTTGVTR